MKKYRYALLLACLWFPAQSALSGPHDLKVRHLLETQIYKWLNSPEVIDAVRSQNARNRQYEQADIDRLDLQWRSERKNEQHALIDKVLNNQLSEYLRRITAQGGGLYAEVFVMDDKGLNVGQNRITSDYWQGDEAKWKDTYLKGPGSLLIGDIKYDESAERFQIQVSVPIVDPASQKNIGAATIGLAMRELVLRKVDYITKVEPQN